MAKLLLKEIVDCFALEVLNADTNLDSLVGVSDINRPGLVLAGYLQYFDGERIQVIGRTEISFLESLEKELANERWQALINLTFPCLIITRNMELPDEWIKIATERQLPILRTHLPTTRFMAQLTDYLEQKLAPSVTIHAVLVDVHGIGTLIIGESGVGKSESALELIRRGHRLVADDAVDVIRSGEDILIGSAPEVLRHVMEVRGLGILNIKALFGIGAIRPRQKIQLVIRLEEWKQDRYYDRLGIDEEQHEILGVGLPCKTIPVRPGRNLSNIIEVAAMNYRLKNLGYDAAEQFIEKQRKYCLTDHQD
ncbi:HPr(Ser) kinase/phosphatase [Pelosinus sp. sgz500959]|uniref:HPr(Ser) kinase/phosphatase n=1 Tax=Pelosinus sp. sgz500959 TaxID=3242472 RepID=UPI003673516E